MEGQRAEEILGLLSMFSSTDSFAQFRQIQNQGTDASAHRFAVMDSRRAHERVRLTDYAFLSMSERTVPRLRHQTQYQSLCDALDQVYGISPSTSLDVLDVFPGTCVLLGEHYSKEDTEPPSPAHALDYILEAAIERFGYSARDVFGAVFNFQHMTEDHEDGFTLKFAGLQAVLSALAGDNNGNGDHTISRRVIALSPVYRGPHMNVVWKKDFKSGWVAKNAIQRLGKEEDVVIRNLIRIFQKIPDARGLAGEMLEPLGHRYIANGKIGKLTQMKSNDADPRDFSLDPDSHVPDNVRFRKVKRDIIRFKSIANLPTTTNRSYYIPDDPNFPLFDAFTTELDYAILWMLLMTTSPMHRGSGLGYQRIRDIIVILKKELVKEEPEEDEPGEEPPKKKRKGKGRATQV